MPAHRLRLPLLLAALLAAAACADPQAEEDTPGPWGPPSNSAPHNNTPANSDPANSDPANNSSANNNSANNAPLPSEGAALYATLCANCHGDDGRGRSGPPLRGWSASRDDLAALIDLTMPLGDPGACDASCAERVADYILAAFPEDLPDAPRCQGPQTPGPRQLRLLTRREYAATVRDLLDRPRDPCASSAACDLHTEVCEGGLCEPLPCDTRTFYLDPRGETWQRVHVAGEFNGWAPTAEGGGWPLTFDPSLGLWTTTRQLTPGTYQYKFVINNGERWIQDPENAAGAPDGFGGQNSLLHVECGQGNSGALAGLTASLPTETRPEGFAFDNHADAGRVTPTHAEEYLLNAERLAEEVVSSPNLLPCGPDDASSPCVRDFLDTFAARAWRRPLISDELQRLTDLITSADTPADGYRVAAAVILSAPAFLYRSELGQPQGDGTWRLDPWEIASLLAYTFWGTLPDAELFAAARSGALASPEGVEAQARRLLDDPRAEDVLGTFALQWLGVERIQTANKNPNLYPHFDAALRQDMLAETRRFVAHVALRQNGRFDDLLTTDASFLNSRLANLYGVQNVQGDDLRLTPLPGEQRAGLLGHASVLASYAHSDQSSPILRGLFVRRNLLCQDLGAPPPNAGGVPDVDPNATTRERFRQHTDNTFCASCHRFIDPIGFGFERFDALGQWRDAENGLPIDPSGDLNDAEGLHTNTSAPFSSLPQLADLLAQSQAAEDCFATQVFRFAAGRIEDERDACAIDALQTRLRQSDGDLRELLVALATLDTFTLRRE